jgi:DUF917 family protein
MSNVRALTEQDLWDLLNGACLLGSGGGGPLSIGKGIVADIVKLGKPVLLADPASIDPKATMAVSADVGSPDAATGGDFDYGAATIAFGVLNDLLKPKTGVDLSYVLPGEVGAGNSFIPMSVAVRRGIPVVDAAGARRAIPLLEMCTYAADGLPVSPLAMGNSQNQITFTVKDVPTAEAAIRGTISGNTFGQLAGVAFWPMAAAAMQSSAIRGCTSYAIALGRCLREAIAKGADPVEAAVRYLEGWVLFRGTVVDFDDVTEGGFDFGRLVLDDGKGNRCSIFNQNESLIAWSTDRDRPLAMGPDLICTMTTDGHPFSNADRDVPKGKTVAIIGAKAPPQMRVKAIVDQFTSTLRSQAWYAGPYVPIEALIK